MKFRKKPVVIDAMRWPGFGVDADKIASIMKFEDWFLKEGGKGKYSGSDLLIQTLEGVMTASPNDWVIKGIKGEFYPCKPDIFESTYDPA